MAKGFKSLDEVPREIIDKLGRYFSSPLGDTFVITDLPPELTGGLMARYSRAPTGLKLTFINEFLDDNGNPSQEKGSALMDRVLNAFGDESVGELEGAHLGVEEISQILTKEFEDRRIGGSPIEQSTRYVRYDQKDNQGRWRYLRPKEIKQLGPTIENKFERVNNRAFEIYSEGIKRLSNYFSEQLPEDKFEIEVEREGRRVKLPRSQLEESELKAHKTAYNFAIRCAALDVGRCVLPASTLTHIGMFGNGRFFTNLITQLKSGELIEARERGSRVEEELKKAIPTFIKRNRTDTIRKEIENSMYSLASELFGNLKPEEGYVTLIPESNFLDETVSSILYPFTNVSLSQILTKISILPNEKKNEIFDNYVGSRQTRRDRTGRGLESGYPIIFDLVGSFGEYRDLERHRMLTQQRQLIGTDLGFILPQEMSTVGLEKEVLEIVDMMDDLNHDLKQQGLREASQYATLFNNRIRFKLGMNLREFQHLSELRTQPAGHFGYRKMVMEMADKLGERDPWTKKFYQFVDYSDPGNKISRANEQAIIARKNLASGIEGDTDY